MTIRSRIILALCALIALPLTACAVYKPSRLLTPEAFGMTCPRPEICIDDPTAFPRAAALYDDAVAFVERSLAPLETRPRLLFCTTAECSARFGLTDVRGLNIGTYGALIADTGWQSYIVRHEIIHHLQNERFGLYPASRGLPRWFIEGMAYVRAGDPRRPFPIPEIEGYITRYEAWEAAGNTWQDLP